MELLPILPSALIVADLGIRIAVVLDGARSRSQAHSPGAMVAYSGSELATQ